MTTEGQRLQSGCFHLLNVAVVEVTNNRAASLSHFLLSSQFTILACPPVNVTGKREGIQHSVTTVKSCEMEVKCRIRLRSGPRSVEGEKEGEGTE